MKEILGVQDLDLKGKRVFLRVDFNVPLKESNGEWSVADDTRIQGALPCLEYIMSQGGRCVLASHLGRPKGKPNPKYSLEPVARALSEKIGKDVILTDDCIGDGARGLSHRLRNGEVMLLENLRFHEEEEANSPDFAARLAELCDVYVTDAFGSLHRAHASTSALPRSVAVRGIGQLVQKELQYLEPLRSGPARPFVLIMGGAKVSDKIGVLEQFMPKVDRVIIGGAMAYAFLRAMGYGVGRSFCQDDQVKLAARLLKSAEARGVQVVLPVDHVVTPSLDNTVGVSTTENVEIPADKMAVDIGPKSIAKFGEALAGAETIFWNGPMGVFETPAFAHGTFELARLIAETTARKLVGGGDSAAAIAEAGFESKFDFISTGGGATLEYLEGKELPGLRAMETRVSA
ncbi:phosphoglycerate kinase [bacterium]|nr:phosphoglycerate kinase [bacterium]